MQQQQQLLLLHLTGPLHQPASSRCSPTNLKDGCSSPVRPTPHCLRNSHTSTISSTSSCLPGCLVTAPACIIMQHVSGCSASWASLWLQPPQTQTDSWTLGRLVSCGACCGWPVAGALPIDQEVYRQLLATGADIKQMDLEVDEAQHSLELRTPYIAAVMGQWLFTLAPIKLGSLQQTAKRGMVRCCPRPCPTLPTCLSSAGPIWKSIQWLDELSMRTIKRGRVYHSLRQAGRQALPPGQLWAILATTLPVPGKLLLPGGQASMLKQWQLLTFGLVGSSAQCAAIGCYLSFIWGALAPIGATASAVQAFIIPGFVLLSVKSVAAKATCPGRAAAGLATAAAGGLIDAYGCCKRYSRQCPSGGNVAQYMALQGNPHSSGSSMLLANMAAGAEDAGSIALL